MIQFFFRTEHAKKVWQIHIPLNRYYEKSILDTFAAYEE